MISLKLQANEEQQIRKEKREREKWLPTAVQGREAVTTALSVNADALLASLDVGEHCCSIMKGKVDQSCRTVHGIPQARIPE